MQQGELKMSFTISFAGAKEYTPYEGGGDLYPFEGQTFGQILKIEEAVAKESKNSMLVFTIGCAEPEAKGMKAKKWVPVTGMRTDGKPNVLGLLDVVASVYSESMSSEDAIAKARSLDGQNLDSNVIINQLTGKTVYYEVRARSFQREDGSSGWSSEIANFSVKSKYNDLKSIGQHHKELPKQVTQGGSAGGAVGGLSLGGGQVGGQVSGQPNGTQAPQQQSGAKTGALGIL
jgi:hypothetical protein